MRRRNNLGQYQRVVYVDNGNSPVSNLINMMWAFLNYLVLFFMYLPWLVTFFVFGYLILSYIDVRSIYENFKEIHICECKLKGKNGI